MEDDGLPNARPIALSDSPRCQRSHNSVFSAAVKPRRYPCHIAKHSIFIFAVKDKVLRRSVETTSESGQKLAKLICPLSANRRHRAATASRDSSQAMKHGRHYRIKRAKPRLHEPALLERRGTGFRHLLIRRRQRRASHADGADDLAARDDWNAAADRYHPVETEEETVGLDPLLERHGR